MHLCPHCVHEIAYIGAQLYAHVLAMVSHKLTRWQWKLGAWWDGLTYRQRDRVLYLALWYVSMLF